MSSEDVIIIILENVCTEVTSKWYINSVIEEEYVKIVESGLHFSVLILILFSFFNFQFLEQLGLGLEVTSYTVTSVTIQWCGHNIDYRTRRMKLKVLEQITSYNMDTTC